MLFFSPRLENTCQFQKRLLFFPMKYLHVIGIRNVSSTFAKFVVFSPLVSIVAKLGLNMHFHSQIPK